MNADPQTARYRLRSDEEIEAVQWTGHNADALRAFCGPDFDTIDPEDRAEDPDQDAQLLSDASHWVGLKPGDWVLKHVDHFTATSDEAFRALWEAVAVQPVDRAALRDRIAEALYAHDHPGHVVPLDETGMGSAYRESAKAVLAVLPPADRAAELASLAVNAGRALQDEKRHYEIACQENARLRATIERVRRLHDALDAETDLTSPDDEITRGAAARKIAAALDGWTDPAELRRVAAEAPQQADTETPVAVLARVRAVCDRLRRASLLADGQPHTDRERGVIQAIDRVIAALDTPAFPEQPAAADSGEEAGA